MLKISNRSNVPVFRTLEILKIANQKIAAGEDIIHLEAGQPSVGVPEIIIEKGIEALRTKPQGYTEALGLPLLREKLATYYTDYYGVSVGAERFGLSVGSSGAFLLTFLAAFDVGDNVAMAAPGYPAYRNILKALGINPVEIETTPADNYQPTIAALEALDTKPDGLIIANPSNPTGTMLTSEELKGICAWCDNNDVRLIVDEIYHGVTFEGKADTALNYTQNAVIMNSFSKYFAMTGWRLGWMVMPKDLTRRIESLAQSMFVSPPTLAQQTAIHVFDHTDIFDQYVTRYKANLNILQNELPKAGYNKLSDTKGAFYIYADIGHMTDNTEHFAKQMLDDIGVAITPGADFDLTRGHGTIRMSFAGSTESIQEACKRLQNWRRNV